MLGVSRNHAHALLSRARTQLEISLGALLVARSGRDECAALSALLEDWDGQLNVLMRKRINRHIEQCPACTERKRRELAPALLLGLAPLPIAVMPPGLRAQVLRLASSNTPEALAHRASVAQGAVMAGPDGFPKPLDPPKPRWRTRQAQGAAAAAVVAVAAVLAILAVTGALGTHHGRLSALSQGSSAPGTAGAPAGGTAPGTQPGGPGSSTQPAATASGAARVSPSPSAGGTSPATGAPSAPGPSGPAPSSAAPSSAAPSSPAPTSHSPSPPHSPSPSSPAPSASSTTAAPPPAPGTLNVTPRTIVLSPLLGGSLTLTASGGPVTWSIAESAGLLGEVSVAPSSGRLTAGQSATVSLRVSSAAGLLSRPALGNAAAVCVGCQLTVNPGGIRVLVVIDVSIAPSSPPPSSGSPPPEARGRLAN